MLNASSVTVLPCGGGRSSDVHPHSCDLMSNHAASFSSLFRFIFLGRPTRPFPFPKTWRRAILDVPVPRSRLAKRERAREWLGPLVLQ